MRRQVVNGYIVESDLIRGYDRPVDNAASTLRIRWGGHRPVPGTVVTGDLLQSLASDEAEMLTSVVRNVDGSIILRVHRHVDFEIAPDLTDVVVWADPDSPPGMTEMFVAGSLMATLLMIQESLVLHASAVEVGGRAVAFVGNSGSGKSTMAARTCGRGGRFVTDDVLRVDLSGPPRCWLGSMENRLRFDVARLSPDLAGTDTRRSIDGRTIWSPPRSDHELCRLQAVILPFPSRDRTTPNFEILQAPEAIMELTRRPRVQGWHDPRGRAAMFRNLAQLVASVPVYRAALPWGPPFDPGPIDQMLHEVGVLAEAGNRPA